MLKLVICDDEEIFVEEARKQIEKILNEEKLCFEITSYHDPSFLLETLSYNQNAFDIIFLDIMMEDYNGIQIAKEIRKDGNNVEIVFITSSIEYSIEGYLVYPLHYLLKPIQTEQLREVLLKYYQDNRIRPTITVQTKSGTSIIEVDKIIYAEMQDRILCLFTEDGLVESTYSLSKFTQLITDFDILRCHKGFLVNLKYVSNIKRYHFILKCGTIVPIGRTYYDEAIHLLLNYVN